MIEITLQEHGTYNQGLGIDISFDLDDYDCVEDITEELFDQTKDYLVDNKIDYDDIMEEWIITDIEIDSEYLECDSFFDEYMSIEQLIDLNRFLKINDTNDISLSIYLDDGMNLKNSIEKIESDDIIPYLIGNLEFKSEERLLGEWLVYESEYFEDLPEKYKSYIDYESFGKNYGMDMITHKFSNGKVYSIINY